MPPITRRAYLTTSGLFVAGLATPQLPGLASALSTGLAQSTDLPASADAVDAYQMQTPHQVLQMDVSAGTWAARFTQLVNQGYRPIWVQGSTNGTGAATYSAIWIRDGVGGWFEWQDLDASTYQSYFDTYGSAGYRPISVSGYQSNGAQRFAAIWLYAPGVAYHGVHNVNGAQYQGFVNDMIAANFTPQVVDGYPAGGGDGYVSIWANTPPAPWVARHGMTSAQYQAEFADWAGQGYRVASLSAYRIGGTTYFAAYWVKDGAAFVASHDTVPGTLFTQAILRERADYQPIVIEGYDTGATRHFAGVWVKRPRTWTITGAHDSSLTSFDNTMMSFMQARNIRGGALAVTKDSRLVYARGFRWDGYTTDTINPDSLFRIASLSKPLTSMAILRLVQEGVLSLSDRLTTLLAASLPAPLDARMHGITVLHLLQHAGGFRRTPTFDPMFRDLQIAALDGLPLPVSRQRIMNYMTTTENLVFTPGTQMLYSNYGYLLLGRIIEQVTGMAYGDYMHTKVFGPLGITRMRLGSSEFEHRHGSEVECYSELTDLYANVRQPGAPVNAMLQYGAFNLENMDAHGAWLASAADLACFATAFDTSGLYPVLNQASINQVFAVPPTGINSDGAWYGCGWIVRLAGAGRNTWHDGSLPGTSTLMVRRHDGLNWVALFNQRDDVFNTNYIGPIDSALHAAADAVTTWPTSDLFPNYGLPLRDQAFTDDPLTAGTPIKSVHLNELRARVHLARTKRGLAPFAYSTTIAAGIVVRAAHVIELRTALAAAYAAAGLPLPTYTDPGLAAGMPIKVAHVMELRSAVRSIE